MAASNCRLQFSSAYCQLIYLTPSLSHGKGCPIHIDHPELMIEKGGGVLKGDGGRGYGVNYIIHPIAYMYLVWSNNHRRSSASRPDYKAAVCWRGCGSGRDTLIHISTAAPFIAITMPHKRIGKWNRFTDSFPSDRVSHIVLSSDSGVCECVGDKKRSSSNCVTKKGSVNEESFCE